MNNITIKGSIIYFNTSPVATLTDPTIFKNCCFSDREDFITHLKSGDTNNSYQIAAYDRSEKCK